MELWIRSKSKKTLVKINAISLSSCSEDYVIESDSDYMLGKYPKKRALEVLGEIQDEISNFVGTMAQIVYEMPEE